MITKEQAIEALRTVIRGRDGYVYKSDHTFCRYADPEGGPSCVVGWGLHHINPALLQIARESETGPTHPGFGSSPSISGLKDPLHLTSGATGVFGAAQAHQDRGGTWGGALAEAEMVYGRLKG